MSKLNWRDYMVSIPEGSSGGWSIERFTVRPEMADVLHQYRRDAHLEMLDTLVGHPEDQRFVEPGTYTKLVRYDFGDSYFQTCWMSDTRPEVEDHFEFIERAHGDVLIHGLGLGMCALAVARKPEVRTVLVIEHSRHVYNLVATTVSRHHKVNVRLGDAFRWKLPRNARWDVAFHDIWPSLSADNIAEMDELEARFAPHVGWQCSWQRAYCERRAAKLRALHSAHSCQLAEMDYESRVLLARWCYFANGGPEVRRAA